MEEAFERLDRENTELRKRLAAADKERGDTAQMVVQMKSKFENLEPSLRKLRSRLSDSWRASSAAAMCPTASRCSPGAWGGGWAEGWG